MRSKKVLYNIISNIFLQITIIVSGFIVPKIIISSFGSDTNGLVTSITQFLAYIALLESGLGPVVKSALYNPIAKNDTNSINGILRATEKFFRRIALVFLGYIAILCILYPYIINSNYDYVFTISLIMIIGISTFAEYYFGMTYNLFLQAKQEKYVISVIQIVSYILSTSSVIILAKMGADIQTIKLASGALFVIRPLIQNYYVKKKYKINYKTNNNSITAKLDKKWDALAQHIAYVIHTKTDVTILTIFTSLIEVSVYSVYYLVVKGIKSLIQAFTSGIDSAFGDMIAKKEKRNLKNKFSVYEAIYYTISTIIFTSTIILIVPFVAIYTKGIDDANYIRPVFATLIVISEYLWAIRQPYNLITQAAGHFKETRKGAWIECITNIVISIILVKWLGIIGVAIGTIIAMAIRTAEFIYYTNKYILDRTIWGNIARIIIAIIETVSIIFICNRIPTINSSSYLSWGINAIIVLGIASIITIGLNMLFYHKEIIEAKNIIIKTLKKKNKKP